MKISNLFTVAISTIYLFVFTCSGIIFTSSCNKEEACLETIWYQDNDNDGRGNPAVSIMDCEQPVGYVNNDIDTDDTQPFLNDLRFQHELNSTFLSETYPVKIFLPGIFEVDKNLPVLYLLDGRTYFEDVIDYTKDIGFDAIIVGIGEHLYNGELQIRARDFIPDLVYEGETGNHLKFYQFLTEEVIPYVDQNYENDTESRTLVGHHAGGLFAKFSLLLGASENLFFYGYLSINPEILNRYVLEDMLDSLVFTPDADMLHLHLSQVSSTMKAEWFYEDLEEQAFPWLNVNLQTIEDENTASLNPAVVEPSVKEGLRFIYDL